MGSAVITTDVPDCGSAVIDLAEKMLFIIEHPERLERMGQESYRIAQEKFDAQEVNQRLLNLLDI